MVERPHADWRQTSHRDGAWSDFQPPNPSLDGLWSHHEHYELRPCTQVKVQAPVWLQTPRDWNGRRSDVRDRAGPNQVDPGSARGICDISGSGISVEAWTAF